MLETSDLYFAAQAGIMRRISAIKANRLHNYNPQDVPADQWWNYDIEGCIAEMLVAKAFNVHWSPYANDPASLEADVGDNIQVRSTIRDNGCLLLHEKDKDDQIFVLVTGAGINKQIRGCILGCNGKQRQFWRESTGRPCYFVPQSVLLPVSSFLS